MQLNGIHHLTAITARASDNVAFYTKKLGLRLVKKTVNQDDTTAYHLFYANGVGAPGTDITFFDWDALPERRGTRSIARTGFRVGSDETLKWWQRRFDELKVKHDKIVERDARATLDFEDPEGQRLSLVSDSNSGDPPQPWDKSPVPAERQIRGLGPITLSVPDLAAIDRVLQDLMNMRRAREYNVGPDKIAVHVYEMGPGGAAAELHVAHEPAAPVARNGAGGVHHVAFRTPNADEYQKWIERLNTTHTPNSGPVDRFYFRSLYFREPNGILFEIATDGPGFASDEPMEHLGEKLSLPPFLEPHRKQIEAELKPIQALG
jgi:glyoxalase family protein